MFGRMIEIFGRIDICVPNSGIQLNVPIDEMTLAQWQRVIDVNLTACFSARRVRRFVRSNDRGSTGGRSAGDYLAGVRRVVDGGMTNDPASLVPADSEQLDDGHPEVNEAHGRPGRRSSRVPGLEGFHLRGQDWR